MCRLGTPLRTQHSALRLDSHSGDKQSFRCSWLPGRAEGSTEEPPHVPRVRNLRAEGKTTPETRKTPAAPMLAETPRVVSR